MLRILGAIALALTLASPADARRAPARHPIACNVVTGGGQYLLPRPCSHYARRWRAPAKEESQAAPETIAQQAASSALVGGAAAAIPAEPPAASKAAIYDIAAHTVTLPDGQKLEAHSGLGARLDDPRYVSIKNRGPTPPGVYDLALRERPFHGVQALRLNPTDESKMFGRAGILAHTNMLRGGIGSNGCVAIRNYAAFLGAYLKGMVDRLVVVAGTMGDAPASAPPVTTVRRKARHRHLARRHWRIRRARYSA